MKQTNSIYIFIDEQTKAIFRPKLHSFQQLVVGLPTLPYHTNAVLENVFIISTLETGEFKENSRTLAKR